MQKENTMSKYEIFTPSAKKQFTCAMSLCLSDASCFIYNLLQNMVWSVLWCKTWHFSVHMNKANKIKLVGYKNNAPKTLKLNFN